MTCLTNHNIPETQIIQLTGHKNLPSLNNYKKASLEQQRGRSTLSGWLGHGLTTFWGWHYIFMERENRLWSHVYKHFFFANNDHIRKIMYYRQILHGVQACALAVREFSQVRGSGPCFNQTPNFAHSVQVTPTCNRQRCALKIAQKLTYSQMSQMVV